MERDKSAPPHGEEPESAGDERAGGEPGVPPADAEDVNVARELGIDKDEALLLLTMGC